jgi:HK97 family phage prohead protease
MKKNATFETKAAATETLEFKRLDQPFSVEKLSESDGTFSGKGMVFDSLHPTSSWQLGPEWKDRVRPGAFADTLAAHKAAGTMPMMLYMHERGNVPGVWTSMQEGKGALQLSGKVSPSAVTPSGVPLLELMKMGAMTGLSIGFTPKKVVLDEEKKVRDILSVDLGEVSIVDIPGASTARITDVKRTPREIERLLRMAGGLSANEAKAVVSGGYPAVEKLGMTKVAKTAIDSSAAADEATNAADEAHGKARVAHAAAMTAHVTAGHDRTVAAKQATLRGDPDMAAMHDAAATEHAAMADVHKSAMSALSSYGPACMAAGDPAEKLAAWTTAYIDDLPDSAFLHVETGGKKDSDGKTTPRALRHFPYKDAGGKLDLPHLRNALARIPQSDLPQGVKDKLTTKAKKLLEDAGDSGADDSTEGPDGSKKAAGDPAETLGDLVVRLKNSMQDQRDAGSRDQRDAGGNVVESIRDLAKKIRST